MARLVSRVESQRGIPSIKGRDKSAQTKLIKTLTKALEKYEWSAQATGMGTRMEHIVRNLYVIENMNLPTLAGAIAWYLRDPPLVLTYENITAQVQLIYSISKTRSEELNPDSTMEISIATTFVAYFHAVKTADQSTST